MTLTDLPAPFVPDVPEMFVGMLVVPVASLVVLILMVRHWSRALPRPALLAVFFGTVAAAVAVNMFGDWWGYSLQTLIAMAAAALGVAAEVAVRRLHRHWASAGAAGLLSLGYYLYLVSVVASAAV